MFALEARRMGYRVHTFSPESDTPTGQVADIETVAEYLDTDAVAGFAGNVDVVTFDFENVPAKAAETASRYVPVHPAGEILHTLQNRLREKTFLAQLGIPVTPFRSVTSLGDLSRAAAEIGLPAVLKTAGFGYDGKGQVKIADETEIDAAWTSLEGEPAVLEAFIDFEKEVSVVCVRDQAGNFAHYGAIENEHRDHILDVSRAPADVAEPVAHNAIEITREIADAMRYVGTMCTEFFVANSGKLLVNEIAPRPHNSGHLTFGGCRTSQFEQQLRAVCGLPLGSTEFYREAAMANLLGDLWANGEPDWAAALADPRVALHLYGKADPRPRRKMGHITATAGTAAEAVEAALRARSALLANIS
jgi:5-(carboxyamino)imidazole ribonucleotide synthase